ncbi:MAG TPA: SurA N-terminal domain-containing protein [Arenicellales bacterium]|nr:SurA N-terminal domain-containing protein [Arenicellales bacterium]
MLSEIRERATGWIAYIIVGIIIIPFAFWGVNEYFAGGEEVVVAKVGDAEIQQVDYRRALDNRRAQMRQILGDDFQPELANSPEFKRGVLDDLVARTLLDQHADEHGYRVGDELLARLIRSNPRFQVDGSFSQDAYRGAVAQMGLNEPAFEARYRRQLLLDQLRNGIVESAFVTPDQRDNMLKLMLETRRFDYAVLEADRYVDEVEVSDAEVQEEYESNSEQYRTPEKLKLEYVELSVDELAESINISQQEIEEAYEQRQEQFTSEPVRRASHILIETPSDAGEAEEQAALEQARELLQRLRDGEDFAALAEEYSDDPGSASKGGDLGRIEPGAMVQPFEEALFSMDEEGALSEPVRTRFGYHIIKLTEYRPASIKPLDEVRDQIARDERRRQAEALFLDRAEAFRNISYEQPQSLEPVADQLDLEIRESEWFTRSEGTGIAADPQVRETAFSDEVYVEELNSQAIELDINTLVVMRKLDTQPASVRPLEEVRGEIEARLKRAKAEEHVAEIGSRIVEDLKGGSAWQDIIEEYALSAETTSWSRSDRPGQGDPHPALVDAVFQLPTPSGDTAVPGGLVLAEGDYALFRVVEVIEGDPEQAGEQLVERVESTLQARGSRDLLEQYIADLREQAEVEIREQAL